MGTLDIILIAVGLAMDAFAVAIAKGLCIKKRSKSIIIIALYFGIFQALMLTIGYFLGFSFEEVVTKIDHYIAFVLLTIIGISMILEKDFRESVDESIDIKTMLLLSVATSIDALAIGVTFAFLNVNIISSAIIVGIITFVISTTGVLIGIIFKNKLKLKAQLLGGIVLILTGLKILLEHLNVI